MGNNKICTKTVIRFSKQYIRGMTDLPSHFRLQLYHMLLPFSASCVCVVIVRDWDMVSVSWFSTISQSYLPLVCCVVSSLLSLNATYFKHASTSHSMTKIKAKVIKMNNPFSASKVSVTYT